MTNLHCNQFTYLAYKFADRNDLHSWQINPTSNKLTNQLTKLNDSWYSRETTTLKASLKVSSATYKISPNAHSERCPAVHGANFTVIYI